MKDGPTVEGCSVVVKRLRRLSGQNESGKELRTAVLAPYRKRLVKQITEGVLLGDTLLKLIGSENLPYEALITG